MITLIVYCEGDFTQKREFEDIKTMLCWEDGFTAGSIAYGAGDIEFFVKEDGEWVDYEGNVLKDEDKIKELERL